MILEQVRYFLHGSDSMERKVFVADIATDAGHCSLQDQSMGQKINLFKVVKKTMKRNLLMLLFL